MYTDYRPTPLQHYMFPAGGDGLYMIVDERGVFREDSFQKAVAALTAKDGAQHGDGERRFLFMGLGMREDQWWDYREGADHSRLANLWLSLQPDRFGKQ